ncbi:MAG TPA: MoxR family ATPase [Planctomycetota bacterium]|nr:MoxR family ATPase [Planctomycetota bacterium]
MAEEKTVVREEQDVNAVAECKEAFERISKEISKTIIGQNDVIEQVLIALFANGHILLIGVPGLAKTLMVSTLANTLSVKFKRLQFTPDMMPSDITGTEIIEEDHTTGRRAFRFVEGPIFSNMILADEINRTPPKTQAALLEAMQERHVTVGKKTYPLEEPFIVLATQNPIEQEGTYPLPEAQLDRFMFNTWVDYPKDDEYHQIIKVTTGKGLAVAQPVLAAEDVIRYRQVVRRIPIADHVIDYIRRLTVATQPQRSDAPEITKKYVAWGSGPRSGQYLALGAKARAMLLGKYQATCEDVRHVAHSVLRHRIFTNFVAQAEGIDTVNIIDQLLAMTKE